MNPVILCNRCEVHALANEAKARGDEVYFSPSENGTDIYVVPKGGNLDLKLRVYATCWFTIGPQRKLWVNEYPTKCDCGSKIPLKNEMLPCTTEMLGAEEVVETKETIEKLCLL